MLKWVLDFFNLKKLMLEYRFPSELLPIIIIICLANFSNLYKTFWDTLCFFELVCMFKNDKLVMIKSNESHSKHSNLLYYLYRL